LNNNKLYIIFIAVRTATLEYSYIDRCHGILIKMVSHLHLRCGKFRPCRCRHCSQRL